MGTGGGSRPGSAGADPPADHRHGPPQGAPSAAGADAVRALKRARPLPRAACTHGTARMAAAGAACRSFGSSVSADLAAALGRCSLVSRERGPLVRCAAGAASG